MKPSVGNRHGIARRSRTRRQLLQTLYQLQLSGCDPETVKANQILDPGAGTLDLTYFEQAWAYIVTHREHLDAVATPYMNRAASTLDPVERAILWIGLFELGERRDIHPNVVIDEAIELAKCFGSDESYKFINGVLDRVNKSPQTHSDKA